MSTIPITSLTPAEPPPSNASIHGIVTLFWPYSSSTRQCAFLLADPDFRLRSRQGQVRVRFTGASAEAVAKSHVGIGDEVVLALHGANWEEDPEATRTPGKSVGGELYFRRRLQLTVTKSEGDVQVNVNAPTSPPPMVEQEQSTTEIATPQPRAGQLRRSLGKAVESTPGYAYTSPAFVKRLRLSGESFLDSAFDPFAEDDSQRTTFGRSTTWRYAGRTLSPTKETSSAFDDAEEVSPVRVQWSTTPEISEVEPKSVEMPPPPRPQLQLAAPSPPPAESTIDDQDSPSTPELHPVGSPTLPLPSPFPVDAVTPSHFPEPLKLTFPEDQARRVSDSPTDTMRDGNDVPMLDVAQPVHLSQIEHTKQAISPAETAAQNFSQPQTPTKIPLTTGFGFGFDGAAASPVSQQKASPQEVEKERVMAQTYRSLFGFAGPSTQREQVVESRTSGTKVSLELEQPKRDAPSQVIEEETVTDAPVEQDTISDANEVSAAESDTITLEPSTDHKLPIQSNEVEIIEIESSSDEESQAEDDAPEELSSKDLQPREAGSRRKSPEIPETYQDSQAEDLTSSQHYTNQLGPAMSSQDNITMVQRQNTDESMLETFIEPEKLYPELPSAELRESAVNVASSQTDLSQRAEPELEIQTTEQTWQQPSYPSLPMSPSNSQSIYDMVSQPAPEVSETTLPPTPQLTQAESSTTHLVGMLPGEQQAPQEILSGTAIESQEQVCGDFGVAEEKESAMVETLSNEVAQEQVSEVLTVSEKTEAQMSEIIPEDAAQGPKSSEQPQIEAPAPVQEQSDLGRMTRAKAKKVNRVSIIPDAISTYFSPKRSSGVIASTKGTDKPAEIADTTSNGHISDPPKQVQLTNGFSTSLSYFTPLARLDALLNPSSQGGHGSLNTVDVLAVVTANTTVPVQAKAGPRDYYTIFRIADSSIGPRTDFRVEVFRPYKYTLPTAKEGDVVLLRAFAVKSRKRQPYLLSSDASAWCVFRYPKQADTADGKGGKRKPKWALRSGEEGSEGAVSEEMKGPPVEFDDEEREHARDLREWWNLTHDGKHDVDDTQDNDGMVETNGHVAVSAEAKL